MPSIRGPFYRRRLRHKELKITVRQQAAELRKADRVLKEEIGQRMRLETELLRLRAKEQRLGRDLREGLGQELTGLSYLAQSLYQKLRANGSAEAKTAGELARSIPRVVGQFNQFIKGLVPPEIEVEDGTGRPGRGLLQKD
jgi:signal transduction histidine kinase